MQVRSPGGGHDNPLQYPCLENPMDRGAWRATVYGVAKSQTWLKWLSTHARTHWWGSSDYRGLLGHCPRNSFLVWNSTSRKFPFNRRRPCSSQSSVSVRCLATFLHVAFSGLPASFYVPNNLSNFFLAVPCYLWNLSSPTRDQTQAPWSGSMESWPLDCLGISLNDLLNHKSGHIGSAMSSG